MVFKVLSVFFTCMIFFGKAGVPAAIVMFKQDLLTILLVCTPGGIAGNIVFTYLSAAILKAIHRYRASKGLIHNRKIFTPAIRRLIRIKNSFGLAGLSFITPMFLSTPLGAFLAERFFRDKPKIILYLSISVIFWEFALYFLSKLFYTEMKGWLF